MKDIDNFKKMLIEHLNEGKKDLPFLDKILLSNNLEEMYEELNKLPESAEKSYFLEKICEELIINSVSKIERSGMKLGLHRMEKILKLLGNPEQNLKVIHIAGTNGKGSVSSYITTTLSQKYKVGMYSSPGMISFNDRIRINNSFITYLEMYNLYMYIHELWKDNNPSSDDNLSFFEILTAVALVYFAKNNVDFVVMEVGLGGRYDGTNIFEQKELSIITKIGLDHTNVLGDSLEKIAYEKAGIIQPNDNVIIYPQENNVQDVITTVAKDNDAKLTIVDFSKIIIKEIGYRYNIFDYDKYKNIRLKMLGEHQIYNATVALAALENLKVRKIITISDEDIITGLETTTWAGRLEWLTDQVLIDGAHNIDGVESLVDYLQRNKINNVKMLLGILTDKDYKEMIAIFEKVDAEFNITKVPIEMRESSLVELSKEFSQEVTLHKNYSVALEQLMKNLKQNDILVISGSLYLIAAARKEILEKYII